MAETDKQLLSIFEVYKQESEQARKTRLAKNRENFACYHQEQDFSYKNKGQSTEFLPKMSMAVEQGSNFLQQGLVDMDQWFKVFAAPGMVDDLMKVKPSEIQKLLVRQLERVNFMEFVGSATKMGMLGSLMIAKVSGSWVTKPKYKVERRMKNGVVKKKLIKIEDKRWQLRIDLVRQEDFHIDPTGRGLYKMQDIYMDLYEIEQLAQGDNAIYDMEKVKLLKASSTGSDTLRDYNRNKEAGQDASNNGNRKRIKLTEIWGNFVNEQGELLWENCVATIAEDRIVIQEPTENPLWHGKDPFVTSPVLTVPGSVWGKALMDAPAALNRALNEMFNLILDGGLMAVHGIKQVREAWLEDPSQIDDGIAPGDTLRVNTACPPGATALERVDTATVPADGINVYNLLNQEFTTSALTNDLRMGAQPFRQVKATEVVESSQAITSMFTGLAKHIEKSFITPILEKSWMTMAQHMDDLDEAEVVALIGKARAEAMSQMGPEELFAKTVQGCVFEVFGISATLSKQKDFTKLQAMLQTVAASPVLMEEFTKKYDFGKLLSEIMRSLDINTVKLEHAVDESQPMPAAPQTPQPGQAQGEMPQEQSQIPQAGAASNQGDLIPTPNFPGSIAKQALG